MELLPRPRLRHSQKRVAKETPTTHDFGDGNGPVPAYRHLNPADQSRGGWVAETAYVAETVTVGDTAAVFGHARVGERAIIADRARVFGMAVVYGNALVYGNAKVCGGARVCRNAEVFGNARVGSGVEIQSRLNSKETMGRLYCNCRMEALQEVPNLGAGS